MRNYITLCLSSLLILLVILMGAGEKENRQQELTERIAPQILRFHVIANSDRKEDQELKWKVREKLLSLMDSSLTRDQLCDHIRENKGLLKAAADEVIKEEGFSYSSEISLESCRFPERTYGNMTFPAGTYDALRVVLGKGRGKNYWCVLYPSLCFLDSTHAVVPEESEELLRNVLPEDDFLSLFSASGSQTFKKSRQGNDSLPQVHFRFKFLTGF